MKKGIDLAKWNKVTDYQSVRNAGVQFAIIKVINSQNKPDSRFHEHVSGMLGAGIPIIGGYTYSYANTADKARGAADALVKTAGPQNITALWLDLEDNAVKGLGSNILNIISIYQSSAQDAGMHFGRRNCRKNDTIHVEKDLLERGICPFLIIHRKTNQNPFAYADSSSFGPQNTSYFSSHTPSSIHPNPCLPCKRMPPLPTAITDFARRAA